MLALMGPALQLDPRIKRDEPLDMLGEYQVLRFTLIEQRTTRKNRKQILTHAAFKHLITKHIRDIEKDLAKRETQTICHLANNPQDQPHNSSVTAYRHAGVGGFE